MRSFHGRIAAILVLHLLSACQPTPSVGVQTIPPPIQSPAVTTPTPQAFPTDMLQPTATEIPSGLVPGSVIADQTLTLDAAQPTAQSIAFDGFAGAVIRVQATRQNTEIEYQLKLMDKYGTALADIESDQGSISEVISEIALPYDGGYQLAVTPTAGSGTVQLSATVLEAASGGGNFDSLPITSDEEIQALGVYHLYQFPLTRGDTISVVAEGDVSTTMKMALTLIAPDGREVEAASADGQIRGFIVDITGTYLAVVSNLSGGAGIYHFRVSSDTIPPTPTTPADIGYDSVYEANFVDQSVLSLTFDGTVGDSLQVAIIEPPKELKIDIYVYSPFDQVIAFAANGVAGQSNTLTELQLPYTGRYRLELRPTGSGKASFSVMRLPFESLSGGGVFGETSQTTLSGNFGAPNVFHFFQFAGVPNDVISVRLQLPENSDLELAMALVSPTGQEMAYINATNMVDGLLELSAIELKQTGMYTIIVYALNGELGAYDINFARE